MSVRGSGWSLVVGFSGLLLAFAGAAQGAPRASAPRALARCSASASTRAPSSRVGRISGIQWATATATKSACAVPAPSARSIPPSPAYHGSPPLKFGGGPVVGSTARPGELTVTPVYWVPSGGVYSIPTDYEHLINQFITDIATDSGKISNVFSIMTEYTIAHGAHLRYDLHAGTPITDTNPLPSGACTPDSGVAWADGTPYSACITSSQLTSEASTFTTAHGLPNSDRAHLYMYFLPEGVETCFSNLNGAGGGSCSLNSAKPAASFCGFHTSYGIAPLVADMNYAFVDSGSGYTCSSDGGSNTGGNQSPNANSAADAEISIASHEIAETITDPYGNAWVDGLFNEIGDDCSYVYGNSTSFLGTPGALYNQTINGHHYFVQEEFSNAGFALNHARACAQHGANDITSARAATFTVGKNQVFKVVTSASPKPLLSETGKLPRGVTFVDNGNGSATIAGTPAARSGGIYQLVFAASNSVPNARATQKFTLTVRQAPVFTTAATTAFKHGVSAQFHVTAVGVPTPSKITTIGTLPTGVTFTSAGKGIGTLVGGTTTKAGSYTFKFSASSVLGTGKQTFTLLIK